MSILTIFVIIPSLASTADVVNRCAYALDKPEWLVCRQQTEYERLDTSDLGAKYVIGHPCFAESTMRQAFPSATILCVDDLTDKVGYSLNLINKMPIIDEIMDNFQTKRQALFKGQVGRQTFSGCLAVECMVNPFHQSRVSFYIVIN